MARAGGKPRWEAEHGLQRGHCRECGAKVEGRRKSWCSEGCVDAYMVRAHPSRARSAVLARDSGVCAACSVDCSAVASLVTDATEEVVALWRSERGVRCWGGLAIDNNWPARMLHSVELARRAVLDPYGWAHLWRRKSFWDADHIAPVAHGGPSELANLQTLCLTCHQLKTQEQRQHGSARG